MEQKFSIRAEVKARTGKDLSADLPQQEVIRLLSETHAYHAHRSGWYTGTVTHERCTALLGEALDRATAYAANHPVEVSHVA